MFTLVNGVAVGLVAIILGSLLFVLETTVAFTPHGTVPADPLVFICEDIVIVLLLVCRCFCRHVWWCRLCGCWLRRRGTVSIHFRS